MQDLKLKKLICLDKPAENNLVSAAPSPTTDGKTETVAVQPAPKNIQAPNTGVQNTVGIITTILVLALILGLTTLIASKLSKKSKKIILSIFMLATATFGGINAFSKLSYAETLVNGKPCQTTGYTDYEVGANISLGLKVNEDGAEGASVAAGVEKFFIKVKGTGDPEKDKAALAAEIDKLKDDKDLLKSAVRNFNDSNPTLKHPNGTDIVAEDFNGGIKQHISKSPKQDDEKQVYQIYANFTTSTGIPVSPIDYL
jgi:hypothetical protein